jgi:RNA polymerase sigma-70 factor, ECF subfamily
MGASVTGEVIQDVDAVLVERAQRGEEVAFEVLVVKYQRRVAASIRRMVRDEGVVEELVQEAFLKAFTGLDGFRPDSAFQPWLMAIGRNVARDHLRAADARPRQVPVGGHDVSGESDVESLDGMTATVGSAEDEGAARQLFQRIDLAIEALPDAQRRALLLREVDGLDYRGIAEALGVPLNTAKSHVLRARDAIADQVRPLIGPTRGRRW